MCEVEIQPLPATGHTLGVDLGVKDVVVTSDGVKSGNPKHLKRRLKHLKRQQRRLARMQKGSNRRRRQKARVARIHRRIANSRQDFLHKTTTELIRQADVIAIEDLNIRGMMKNHHLAGAIADVGMGEFRRQLEYKAGWYGRQVVTAHRFAPTSKTCNECQVVQPVMPLHIRTWTCPDCGAKHDRDVNAAINILKFSTLGNRGINVRGQSKNLSASVGTLVEAQTESKNSSKPTVRNGRRR
jgi:putative transposase